MRSRRHCAESAEDLFQRKPVSKSVADRPLWQSGRPPPTTNTSDPTSDESHAESEITAVTSAHELDKSDSIDIHQGQIPFKPSSSLMQIKAEEILQDHLVFLAKRQLRAWRDKAFQIQEDNAQPRLDCATPR